MNIKHGKSIAQRSAGRSLAYKTSTPVGIRACLLISGVVVTTLCGVHGDARAELSGRAASRAWNIEHGLYSDKCDPAKPIPARVDDQDAARCESAVEREAEELAKFSPDEQKEPRVVALGAIHNKLVEHAKKVKAAYENVKKQAAAAESNYQAFYKEAQEASPALYFLSSLERQSASPSSIRETVEERVTKALALGPFAARCASTYAALKPDFKKEGLEGDPAAACGLASRASATMKKEVPPLFSKMRAQNVSASKERRDKIESGGLIFAGDLACAREPKNCGTEEAQIARIAKALEVSPGAPPPTEDAAFAAAMKKGASVLRMGKTHDAAREAIMKAALAKAKIATVALALSSADEVRKNDIGIPLSKIREGHFLVKKSDEAFCRAYDISVVANHQGGGRYGAFISSDPKVDDNNVKFAISACK